MQLWSVTESYNRWQKWTFSCLVAPELIAECRLVLGVDKIYKLDVITVDSCENVKCGYSNSPALVAAEEMPSKNYLHIEDTYLQPCSMAVGGQ